MSLAAKFTHLLPPEAAHSAAMLGLDMYHALRMSWMIASDLKANPQQVMGLSFDNPIGLAAGLDKNGDHIDSLGTLGFGFIEVGTVTPRPQGGNPKPRLFRLPEHQAIINRMGFNNKGLDHMLRRIKCRKYAGVLGVNIGKNATTPLENALHDYQLCLEAVHGYADYVVVNLSSPNTPNLRQLQFGEPLKRLVSSLREQCYRLDAINEKRVPLVVKIAPDMSLDDLLSVADTLMESSVDGVIATNTTVERDAVAGHQYADEAGGLSGLPVRERSTEVVNALYRRLKGELPIIGVGGIFDERSAAEKREAGASLLQLYTGFIYRGSDAISAAARGFKQAKLLG